jgi:DNA replicative helicase MCM subunit Mcm2 (Cdc46/Mcm family)
LFDDEALRKAIIKTGGSLRDLFGIIRTASRRAARRKSKIIEGEDVDRALIELKSSLTRRIERKNYKFLAEIYYKSKATIEDTEMLLEMMQANVVLEYNGTRWHNVHPLVADFLEEIGGRNLLNDRE